MPVTELALLHFKPPGDLTPALRAVLARAKAAMSSFTHEPFHILRQVEDPAYLYVLGTWPSRAAHVDEFIPSATNTALMAELSDALEVVWLHHLDAPAGYAVTPATGPVGEGAAVLSIARHFVAGERKAEFEEVWKGKRPLLDRYTKAGTEAVAGWTVEAEGREEFVLVLGWEALNKHYAFGNSEAGKEYLGAVRALLEEGEVKHAEVLDLE